MPGIWMRSGMSLYALTENVIGDAGSAFASVMRCSLTSFSLRSG